MTLVSRLEAHVRENPGGRFCTFLSEGSIETITFATLWQNARAYAQVYRERGVRPGAVVLVILHHSPHLFYSFVGALLAGAIPSFMPFPSAKQRVDLYWIDHAVLFERLAPRLIITYAENFAAARATIENFPIDTIVAGDVLLVDDPTFVPWEASADDVACLQHSSGTTGLKKGVMLTHRAILDHVAAYGRSIEISPTDRIVSWLPLYHDMGFIACFMMAIVEGLELVALDPFEWVMRPASLFEAIERYRATLCWLPNFAFAHLVKAVPKKAAFDLRSMRAFVNCSEPCKPGTLERFVERFHPFGVGEDQLRVCYAMAENVFAVTQTVRTPSRLTIDSEALSLGSVTQDVVSIPQALASCGTPIEDVRLRVCAPDGNELPANAVGEIWIASPFLFRGYYRQSELTANKMHGKWYATGDLGFLHDGELYVTGRVDDLVIINGRNYYAHEIELAVSDVAGVIPGRSVALGVEDESGDATVLVILAECSGTDTDPLLVGRRIRQLVIERLGIAVHSVLMLAPGELIKTTSGKLSRAKNKELYTSKTSRNGVVVTT